MSRSHAGKIKLDIERLQRRGAKLARRFEKLQTEMANNYELTETLKKVLFEKTVKEVKESVEA
jgi:hypothetical protein